MSLSNKFLILTKNACSTIIFFMLISLAILGLWNVFLKLGYVGTLCDLINVILNTSVKWIKQDLLAIDPFWVSR